MLKQFLTIFFAVFLSGVVLIFTNKQFVETQYDSEPRTNNKTKLQLCMDRIEAELKGEIKFKSVEKELGHLFIVYEKDSQSNEAGCFFKFGTKEISEVKFMDEFNPSDYLTPKSTELDSLFQEK